MKAVLPFLLLICFNFVQAQNEYIDTSFGTNNGYTLSNTDNLNLWLTNLVEYNGAIYASHFNFNDEGSIIKHDTNGIVDTSFGVNGSLDINELGFLSFNAQGFSKGLLTVTSDDHLLLVNGSYTADDTDDFKVMTTKFDENGNLDASYGTNGQYISQLPVGMDVIGTYQTPDDKMLIMGYNSITNATNTTNDIIFMQIDASGQLDSSFGTNGVIVLPYDYPTYYLYSAIYKDLSIYMLFDDPFADGYMTKYDLTTMSYDNSFGANGQLTIDNFTQEESLQSFMIDADDNIYVAGSVLTGNNLEFELFVYKYANGILDSNFGSNGMVNFQLIPNSNSTTKSHSIKQHDDKLLIMGTSYNWDAENYNKTFFAQFNLDGSLDTDFGLNGIIINYLFDNLNVPFDYINYPDAIITCGTCPDGPDPQVPCLVKYLKNPSLSVTEFETETIEYYPNPINDVLTFKTNAIINFIEVYDVLGRSINTYELQRNQVGLSPLNKGTYFIKAYTEDQIFNLKVIKQ